MIAFDQNYVADSQCGLSASSGSPGIDERGTPDPGAVASDRVGGASLDAAAAGTARACRTSPTP